MHSRLSLLPTDEIIFERSKIWSNFLSRVVKEEDFKELYYDDIPSDDEDVDESESDANENQPAKANALVKVDNFEATSSSDEFDVDDLVNETIPVIEERKRKWKESGMDRILDTFDLETITEKVGSWLRTARKDKCSNSSIEDEQIVHFENHQIHFNSDDSLQSADTAKYILSNRKPRAASCTTMTIKRFRYVKGKQKELQRKYAYDVDQDLENIFNKRCGTCLPRVKSRIMTRAQSEMPSNCLASLHKGVNKSKHILSRFMSEPKEDERSKHQLIRTIKSRHRKRRSDTSRKRSVSSSSSSSSKCSKSYTRPRLRRVNRRSNKNDKSLSVNSTSTTAVRKESPTKISQQIRKSPQNKLTKLPANVKSLKDAQSSNSTCFLPENIVNSTALSNTKTVNSVSTKTCQLSPIPSKRCPETRLRINKLFTEGDFEKKSLENEKLSKKQACIAIKCSDRRILVYSPKNQSMHKENISNGRFRLTEEVLRKSIGEKAARRFITFNAQEFPREFDSSSIVYFELPSESENSHRSGSSGDSDEDVLNMFGKQGKLFEQTTHDL